MRNEHKKKLKCEPESMYNQINENSQTIKKMTRSKYLYRQTKCKCYVGVVS